MTGCAPTAFPLATLVFRLSTPRALVLPSWPADAIARALKTAMMRRDGVGTALGGDGRIASYLFLNRKPPGAAVATGRQTPNPLIVVPPEPVADFVPAGGEIAFGVTLVGHARTFWRAVVEGVALAAERDGLRLTPERHPLALVAVDERLDLAGWRQTGIGTCGADLRAPMEAETTPPPCPTGVVAHLLTPTALRVGVRRERRELEADEVTPALWAARVHDRVAQLARLHGGPPMAALAAPPAVEGRAALGWAAHLRPATTQRPAQPMGGVVGTLQLAGPDLARLWPALWWGQWLHVGNGAAAGLGRYRLSPAWRD